MYLIYNTDNGGQITNNLVIYRINNRKINYECPDDCRKSICSAEEQEVRNWGSAGRKEKRAILNAEQAAKQYNKLYNIQSPKTIKNYFKRGYYGLKRVFNRKSFTQRVQNAEQHRNRLVNKIRSARSFNRKTRRERDLIEMMRPQFKKQNPFIGFLKRGFSSIKSLFQ